ncbi:MAG: ribonuclease D [Alphaproteobacteria bacterium]|nr:ribonuclease D [Alphaproteobacteria bacterium]
MIPISKTAELRAFCRKQANAPYITVDTEFLRDKTFWPVLCLVQIAGPDDAVAIDTMADGLSLKPLYDLLDNPKILKVFHAARQDLEIFYHRMDKVPAPIFDTQVAAMVCGFGDQVGYETIVSRLVGAQLDKMSRFADWSRRPLTQKQLDYALADVVHLRPVYDALAKRLAESGRAGWLDEEMATLTDPATYRLDPDDAWRRVKTRGGNSRFYAVLREVAAWREREAQRRDIPRNRILRDDSLLDVAAHAPQTQKALGRTRGLSKGFAEGKMGGTLLAAVEKGLKLPKDEIPSVPKRERLPAGIGPLTDLLKVLLKHECEKEHVASRLVASAADLTQIAANDEADVPALKGWRRELFGERALALKHGRLALSSNAGQVTVIKTGKTGKSGRQREKKAR